MLKECARQRSENTRQSNRLRCHKVNRTDWCSTHVSHKINQITLNVNTLNGVIARECAQVWFGEANSH